MTNLLPTLEKINSDHNFQIYENEAEDAFDKYGEKMKEFLQSRYIDPDQLKNSLKILTYLMTVEFEKRLSIEQKFRSIITERNKAWIKRLEYFIEDPDLLTEFLLEERVEDIKEYIKWLKEEIVFWTKKSRSSDFSQLHICLLPVYDFLDLGLNYEPKEIKKFFNDLFLNFNFDDWETRQKSENIDRIEHMIKQIKKVPYQLIGIPIYYLKAKNSTGSERNKYLKLHREHRQLSRYKF